MIPLLFAAATCGQPAGRAPYELFPYLSICDLAFDAKVQRHLALDQRAIEELALMRQAMRDARAAAERLAAGPNALDGAAWEACPDKELWQPKMVAKTVGAIVGTVGVNRLRELSCWARGAGLATDPHFAGRFPPNAADAFVAAGRKAALELATEKVADRRTEARKRVAANLPDEVRAALSRLIGPPPPDEISKRLLEMVPVEGPFPLFDEPKDLAWRFGWISAMLEKPEGAALLGLERNPAALACQQRRASTTTALRWLHQSATLYWVQQRFHFERLGKRALEWRRESSATVLAELAPEDRAAALSLFAAESGIENSFNGTLQQELGTTRAQQNLYDAIEMKPRKEFTAKNRREPGKAGPPPHLDTLTANKSLREEIFTPEQREKWDRMAARSWPKEKVEAVRQLTSWGRVPITLIDGSDAFD